MVSLDRIRSVYQASLAEHGDTPAAVQWPKGRQDIRFRALTRHMAHDQEGSLLDFGCGLGHMAPFLAAHFPRIRYSGADIVPEFIDIARRRSPGLAFELIRGVEDIAQEHDYIVASGVFNLRYLEDDAANAAFVFSALKHLFSCCRTCLSVNFMSDQVDFRQAGAHHQDVMALYDFCRKSISPRLMIDQSYMPYEFTITLWRNATILRPDHVYATA